jgi:hypothetical protein
VILHGIDEIGYDAVMSETLAQTDGAGRDAKSGRFLSGCKPGPGRQAGSRNRLADAFVQDLAAAWNQFGEVALKRCAEETPDKFCKIVADLMPRDVNLNLGLDATAFSDRLAQAAALLGHDIDPPRQVRRPLPGQHIIEHDDVGSL